MSNKLNTKNKQKNYEDEIDLVNLFKLLIRNKKLISITTIIFFITSCLYGLLSKRVWEGKFAIVLEKKQSFSLIELANNAMQLRQAGAISRGGVNLDTEIGILESPSVLLPIYDFINKEKTKTNTKHIPISFEKWKKTNLEIKQKPRTTILDISYKDSDKELIIPVLSKISNVYQDYSGRNTKRKLTLSKNYLTEQIKKYKVKTSKSLRESQEFAFDQDLTMLDFKNFDFNNNGEMDDFEQINNNQSTILLEQVRLQSLNNIRNIDKQIEQLNLIDNSNDQLAYIANNIKFLKDDKIFQKINEIEENLFLAKSKYTEKDSTLIKLSKEKQISLKILKERVLGNLQALRIIEKAKMDSVTRPKDVVLKYKDLIRTAARDQQTLIELENQLRFISLEEAKYEDPWDLITQPTIDQSPVAPKRKRIALTGGLIGFVIGGIASIIRDKKETFIDSD